MRRLNYHHLHYFWMVARQGKLTETAELLKISQSALSMQIRQLEEDLGQALFHRKARKLELTEAGQIAFSHANEIFRRGDELRALLVEGQRTDRQHVRIGAVATLSRNFQEAFVRPIFDREDVHLIMQSGRLEEMLSRLATHSIDLLLSNVPIQGNEEHPWRSRLIAQQAVSIIGHAEKRRRKFKLPEDLHGCKVLLPGQGSEIRNAFELLCEQWEVHPNILAEVDDMAMLRLLARDSAALAILPKVVVRDEINSGLLVEHATLPGVFENFYGVRVRRQFESPIIRELMRRPAEDYLNPEFEEYGPGK